MPASSYLICCALRRATTNAKTTSARASSTTTMACSAACRTARPASSATANLTARAATRSANRGALGPRWSVIVWIWTACFELTFRCFGPSPIIGQGGCFKCFRQVRYPNHSIECVDPLMGSCEVCSTCWLPLVASVMAESLIMLHDLCSLIVISY